MTVWVVLQNGSLSEIFDNEEAARNHQKNLTKRWNTTLLLKKEVKSL